MSKVNLYDECGELVFTNDTTILKNSFSGYDTLSISGYSASEMLKKVTKGRVYAVTK